MAAKKPAEPARARPRARPPAARFKTRDDGGATRPTAFAIASLSPAEEARIVAVLEKALGSRELARAAIRGPPPGLTTFNRLVK